MPPLMLPLEHKITWDIPLRQDTSVQIDTLRQGFAVRQLQDGQPAMQLDRRRAAAARGPAARAHLDPVVSGLLTC